MVGVGVVLIGMVGLVGIMAFRGVKAQVFARMEMSSMAISPRNPPTTPSNFSCRDDM